MTVELKALREAVEAAVRKALAADSALQAQTPPAPVRNHKKLAVLFTGSESGLDAALNVLREVRRSGVALIGVLSHSGETVLSSSAIENHVDQLWRCQPEQAPLNATRGCAGLFVATLTTGTAAKAALGIPDSVPVKMILETLGRGRPVLALRSLPEDPGKCPYAGLAGRVPAFRRRLGEHLAALENYGVEFLRAPEVSARIERIFQPDLRTQPVTIAPRSTRQIVTGEDILAARAAGRILVAPNAIITDVARELAKDHGVAILED